MNMKYLVLHKDKFEIMDDLQSVLIEALVATFEWCNSPSYPSNDWKSLYKECVSDSNFGDIIKVFEVTPTKAENFIALDIADIGDTFQLKRIM